MSLTRSLSYNVTGGEKIQPYIPYLPDIPYFPNMPYQTGHTHHTYPTYHTTPPPHHRGGRGKISYGASIWDPAHGGGGGVAGLGAYICICSVVGLGLYLVLYLLIALFAYIAYLLLTSMRWSYVFRIPFACILLCHIMFKTWLTPDFQH